MPEDTLLTAEERLRKMENLLVGIVNATKCLLLINDYDLAINQAIAMLGKATEVDGVRIFALSCSEFNRPIINRCFSWVKEPPREDANLQSPGGFALVEEGFERWYELLKNGCTVKGAVRQLPARERSHQALAGVRSLLACPIMIKGELWGLILYENLHSDQNWGEQEEAALTTVAAGLGSVIDRKRTEEALGYAYEELESRVNKRTQELTNANKNLHHEINERIQMEAQLRYLGQHDALTGLQNRAYFQEEMRALDNGSSSVGIILCDVDGLKLINDFLGHDSGDQLLISTGKVLKMCFREDDCIARIGGDEFAVLLKNTDEVMLERAFQRIKAAIGRFNQQNSKIPLSLSVGWAARQDYAKPVSDLFREADQLMYKEKVQSSQKIRSTIAKAMMKILQERDFFKEGYEFRLEKMVANLAIAAGVPEERLNDLVLLAQFHNYGKVAVPPEIMLKEGTLSAEDRAQIHGHCQSGQRITQMVPELLQQAQWIYSHHEWWNGQGAPAGIAGEKIPLEARILAVCDLYDVLTNETANHEHVEHKEAVRIIQHCSGTRLDPELARKFIEITN